MTNSNELNVGSPSWNYHVWLYANQFRDAGNLLFETSLSNHAAILMNYSFACELALKACSVQTQYNCKPTGNGIIPTASFKSHARGHKLADVFDKLPQKSRLAISAKFQELTNQDLRNQLVEFNDYFVDIRYSFEKRCRSWNLTGMAALANAVLDATMEARADV